MRPSQGGLSAGLNRRLVDQLETRIEKDREVADATTRVSDRLAVGETFTEADDTDLGLVFDETLSKCDPDMTADQGRMVMSFVAQTKRIPDKCLEPLWDCFDRGPANKAAGCFTFFDVLTKIPDFTLQVPENARPLFDAMTGLVRTGWSPGDAIEKVRPSPGDTALAGGSGGRPDGGSGDDALEGRAADDTLPGGTEADGFLPSPEEAAKAVDDVLDRLEEPLLKLDPELAAEAREAAEKIAGIGFGAARSVVGSVEDIGDLAADLYDGAMFKIIGDEDYREGFDNLVAMKDGLADIAKNPEKIPAALKQDFNDRKAAADALSEEGRYFEANAAYAELAIDYASIAIPGAGVATGTVKATGKIAKGARKLGDAVKDAGKKKTSEVPTQLPRSDVNNFRDQFRTDAEFVAFKKRVESGVPLGFKDKVEIDSAIAPTRDSLDKLDLGSDKAQIGILGSSVAGRKFVESDGPSGKFSGPNFGKRQDGRNSDHDFFIASPDLFEKAKSMGVEIRGNGTRTKELSERQLKKLGLVAPTSPTEKTGIVLYRDSKVLEGRGPNIMLEHFLIAQNRFRGFSGFANCDSLAMSTLLEIYDDTTLFR